MAERWAGHWAEILRSLALGAALALAAGPATPLAAQDDPAGSVADAEFAIVFDPASRRLRLDVRNEPLTEVLEAVAAETDIALVVRGSGYGDVTARFDLPLEDGLSDLLQGQGHVLVWDRDRTQVRRILLLSPPGEPPLTRVAVEPETARPGSGLASTALPIDAAQIEAELAQAIEQLQGIDDVQQLLRSTPQDLEAILNLKSTQDLSPEMRALIEGLATIQPQDLD